MNIDYLKSHFQKMDTKELVRIIYFDKDSYADETIKEAISELKRRGDYKKEIVVPIADQIKAARRTVEEKHLSKNQKVFFTVIPLGLFTILPLIGFFLYPLFVHRFTPQDWKKRNMEVDLYYYLSALLCLGILGLVVAVLEFIKPEHDFPALYFFSIEIAAFVGFFFAYRSTKRKLITDTVSDVNCPVIL
ncbi:MAG: hypothetical protein P4L43_17550 [Syntrophobacteraceae bacterium]|nr:hypothetical protein [Syntrophobacteraceae bacterium]